MKYRNNNILKIKYKIGVDGFADKSLYAISGIELLFNLIFLTFIIWELLYLNIKTFIFILLYLMVYFNILLINLCKNNIC